MHPDPAPTAFDIETLARALRAAEPLEGGLQDGPPPGDVLGAWYRAEYAGVHRLCQGFLASRAGADDVAQDAMLHLADKLEQWDPARPYAAWRNRVVLHLCRDRERAVRRRAQHEGALEPRSESELDPAEIAAANEATALVDQSLGVLRPREREVFVLIDLEGFTAQDAAEQLGVAASTVRAALALARRRLRAALAPQLGMVEDVS
ncbi:MAG: sigma-70 family RNA polymerase sigma factor [Planctomycetota bacterium]